MTSVMVNTVRTDTEKASWVNEIFSRVWIKFYRHYSEEVKLNSYFFNSVNSVVLNPMQI